MLSMTQQGNLKRAVQAATVMGTDNPLATLEDITGGLVLAYVAKTANYTLTSAEYTVDCTSNSFTLTLPTAVGATGRVFNMKNSGTGIITINTTSSQTIDGEASGALTLLQYENLQVQSDGANWIIL